MKILITGASGLLGSELVKKFHNEELLLPSSKALDITNGPQVLQFCLENKPEVIIHSAAYTKVDDCELRPEYALAVNADGCKNIAVAADSIGARVIEISTDYVFDGKLDRPYNEYDLPRNPLSVYGQSKLLGEQNIQNFCSDWMIVRISWLYGENGKNFVSTMLQLAKKGLHELKVVNDQIGNPTSAASVADVMERLLQTDYRGVVHATCEGEATWYDFAQEIFRLSGIKQKVIPCTTEEFPRPAPRPRNSRLDKQILRELHFPPMPDWKEELSLRIQGLRMNLFVN